MKSKQRKINGKGIFIGVLSFVVGFTLFSSSGFSADKEIVIGGSVPLSGKAAETGLNVHYGYKAAVKYINEVYGGVKVGGQTYKLNLNMFDDASDPSRATTLIQRQIDEGVNFFLGSFGSNIVLPTCDITERSQRPMVQAGGGSDLIFTQGRKYVFGLFPRASRQFYTVRDYLNKLGNVKTFAIVTTNDAYSKSMAEGTKKTLEDSGYQVLDYYQLPAEVSDVSSVLASVRSKKPDALLATTHDQVSMLIAKQMVTTNTTVNMLYFALGPYTKAFRDTLGKYANDIITPIYWDENAAYEGAIFGKARNFAEYYRKNFDRELTYHQAGAAACIVAYVHAIQKADSLDPKKVRDALAALDVMSFYGRLKFAPEGDGVAEYLGPVVSQVQNLKMELLYPSEAATSKIVFPMTPWEKR
jgi:branched-chain amino acid transport system substrate-binding protein